MSAPPDGKSDDVRPAEERFPVWTDIEVRFRDCDPMKHVNNAVYATYLEVARQAYWRRFLAPREYDRVPFVIARLEMDYRSAAWVGETLRAYIRVPWIGERSFGAEYEIRERETGRLVLEARSVQATFDHRTGSSMAVPEALRAHLEATEGRPLPPRPQSQAS